MKAKALADFLYLGKHIKAGSFFDVHQEDIVGLFNKGLIPIPEDLVDEPEEKEILSVEPEEIIPKNPIEVTDYEGDEEPIFKNYQRKKRKNKK